MLLLEPFYRGREIVYWISMNWFIASHVTCCFHHTGYLGLELAWNAFSTRRITIWNRKNEMLLWIHLIPLGTETSDMVFKAKHWQSENTFKQRCWKVFENLSAQSHFVNGWVRRIMLKIGEPSPTKSVGTTTWLCHLHPSFEDFWHSPACHVNHNNTVTSTMSGYVLSARKP